MVTAVIIADKKSPNANTLIQLLNDCTSLKWICGNSIEEFRSSDALKDASVIVSVIAAGGNTALLTELWPLCPQLKWVHSLASGVEDIIPQMLALPRGAEIPLTNGRSAFSHSLAEYSMAAMLHFNKQVAKLQDNKKSKKWDKFIMNELKGMTVGFVGFGDIAQTCAPLCRSFGMKVIALRQSAHATGNNLADKIYCCGTADLLQRDQKLDLFREADFVICSLPGGSATTHFCDKDAFAAMKPSGVFISIGRGTCVDEKALVDALTKSQIAGAALDVFEREPLPADSPVWTCPNLLLSPHNAFLTSSYLALSWEVFLSKLAAFTNPRFAGFDVEVDKAKGY